MSNSPFTPGYGRPPLVFGGHQDDLNTFERVFADYDFGENQSVLISGLRGAGKTSMLSELRRLAEGHGWSVISDDASSGMFERITDSAVPRLVNGLHQTARKKLAGLGIWQFNVELQITDTTRPVKHLLRTDFLSIAESTDNNGILITIDEVASGRTDKAEIRDLALEASHAIQQGVNLVIAFAGIKIDLDDLVRQQHLTFLRRSRHIEFNRLSPDETHRVLTETAQTGGRGIDPEAARLMLRVSQGYPYLVQLLGDYAWRHSPASDEITLSDAQAAREQAVEVILERVISRAYEDLSEVDQFFVQAMAAEEDRAKMQTIIQNMATLAERAGRDPKVITPQYVHQYKQRLMDSGYVEKDGRGYVRFSLPYLGDYLRAVIAEQNEAPDDEGRTRLPNEWDSFPPPSL